MARPGSTFDLLILGGGPAALSAARAYRDAAPTGTVALVSDEERIPYNRPPLTKELLRGEIAETKLAIEEEQWFAEQHVGLISGRAVTLEPHRRTVTLSGGRTLGYRTCLLATGAEPARLPLPGADDPGVRVMRSLAHLRELKARLVPGEAVIVIGSGFIGCEIAASLAMRGQAVTLVSSEAAPNLARLGAEAAGRIAGWLGEVGVERVSNAAVTGIDRAGDGLVVTAGGRSLRAPLIVMAVGVAPRSELAAPLEIELHDGAIPVDGAMRSSVAGVLAAGDVAFAHNAAAGRSLRVEHWGDALGQGAIAGATAAGRVKAWDEVPGFWSTIATHTLKYAAWGDGYDEARFKAGVDGAFTVRYGRGGRLVGLLAHGDDDAYDRGREAIAQGATADL